MPTLEVTEPDDDEVYMTTVELSERWRVDTGTLANIRARGEGIPFLKLPSGAVLYKLKDVLAAEKDGQKGFSWSRLRDALAQCPGYSLEEVDRTVKFLRKQMR